MSGAAFSTNLPILGVLNFIWGITVMVPFGFLRALQSWWVDVRVSRSEQCCCSQEDNKKGASG